MNQNRTMPLAPETDSFWLLPDAVFDGESLHSQAAVMLQSGCIQQVVSKDFLPPDIAPRRVRGLLCAGFFDIQINGGGNVLFNADQSVSGLQRIADAHHLFGTRFWLPTVITDAPEVMARAVDAVLGAYGQHGISGLHIEGPHIAIARKGTHNPALIRPLDDQTFHQIDRLRSRDIPVLLTLAPEAVSAGQIAALVRRGVVVSLGHTDATAAETTVALAEGAAAFTHLFNAMSQLGNREPGVVGAALDSGAYASIIADGVHVSPSVLALACRARKVADRMILVTDAMPTLGGADSFVLYGRKVQLIDGRLVNADGALAGAHTTIPQGIATLLGQGLARAEVLRMATSNPARLMGLPDIGQLAGCRIDDAVLLQDDFSVVALKQALAAAPIAPVRQ